MSLPPEIAKRLRLPVICSPLFIISNPDLTIAQCKAGVVGSFPSLNARPLSQLDEWLARITEELAAWDRDHPDQPSAPFAVNQIVHKTNDRLEKDLELCEKYKVPMVITSLGAREELNQAVHGWGGTVMHDIINDRFARKAIEKGADIGSMFIASEEANADQAYKQMIVDSKATDIVYSNLFTGVHGNYLAPSIAKAGLDPANLPESDPSAMNFGSGGSSKAKAWKDIWGCGQGIGVVDAVRPAANIVDQLADEYHAAAKALDAKRY
jgi:nitronate monooxygenase